MKIRTDFVTNSSSSSFVAYAVYSDELWDFIQEMIDNGALKDGDKGEDGYYGPSFCSYLNRIDQGVSISGQLEELTPYYDKNFNIDFYEDDDERDIFEIIEDNLGTRNLEYLHEAVAHFFDGISTGDWKDGEWQSYKLNCNDKDKRLDAILEKALAENKVRSRTFVDATDGCYGGAYVYKGYEPPVEYVIDGDTLTAYVEQPGITSVIIPDTVKTIGDCAFMNCIIKSVIIPEGVTSIGDEAFAGCGNLSSITVSKSVESIGNDAFLDFENGTIINGLTIIAPSGSYAEEYAKENSIPFETID